MNKLRSRSTPVIITLFAFLVYTALFIVLQPSMGLSVGAFAIIPTLSAASFWGVRGGLIASMLSFPSNSLLLYVASKGLMTISLAPREGSLPGTLALILIGAVVGRLSDLNKEIKHARAAHQSTEKELNEVVNSIPEYLWSGRGDGQGRWSYDFYSSAVEDITGRPPEFYMESPARWLSTIHEKDRPHVEEAFARVMAGAESPIENEYRIVLPNGDVRWVLDRVNVTPLHEQGFRAFGVVSDITDRKQADEERQRYIWFLESLDRINQTMRGTNHIEEMMREVLDQVLALFGCDRAFLVYPADPKAAAWTVPMERTVSEYPGVSESGESVPSDPEVAGLIQLVLNSDKPVQVGAGAEYTLPEVTAKRFKVQSMIAMAIHPAADKPYVFGVHQCAYPRRWKSQEVRLFQETGRRLADTLNRLLIQRALKESVSRLNEAEQIAHVGYWDRDISGNKVALSDEAYRIFFGAVPQEPVTDLEQWHNLWKRLIHPDDRERTEKAAMDAQAGASRYDVEYRVKRSDGQIRTVRARGDVTFDEKSQPQRMFGTIQDITDYKELESSFERAQKNYRSLFENVSEGVYRTTVDGRLLQANPALIEMLGYDSFEELAKLDTAKDVYVDSEEREHYQKELLSTGKLRNIEMRLRRKDGKEIVVLDNSLLSRDVHEEVLFTEGTITDITELRQREQELEQAYDSTIEGLGRVLDLRDRETQGHSQRVAFITSQLAKLIGVGDDEWLHIRRGALLHDIGKVGIPDHILFKSGKLNEQEWEIMREHPVLAKNMLYEIEYLRPALEIPYSHHEKWDGTGYPLGLSGKDIPLSARLFAVADVWDALLSKRPYREAWAEKDVLAYIRDAAGTHFDPEVVEVFLANYDQLKRGTGAIKGTKELKL